MFTLIDRWSVRVRLAAGFGIAGLALVILAVCSTTLFGSVRTTATQSAGTSHLVAIAGEAKFAAADWNGWQTAYSLDANLKDGAMDASGGSRESFSAAATTLSGLLDRLAGSPGLTAE